MKTRKSRDQVDVALTWNLNDLFESQEAWEAELTDIVSHLPVVTAFQGQLHTSVASWIELFILNMHWLLIRSRGQQVRLT